MKRQSKNGIYPHEAWEGDDMKQFNQKEDTWLQIPVRAEKENSRVPGGEHSRKAQLDLEEVAREGFHKKI